MDHIRSHTGEKEFTSYYDSYYSPSSVQAVSSFSGDDIRSLDSPNPTNVFEYDPSNYNPSDYDAPDEPASLLMFTNESDYVSFYQQYQYFYDYQTLISGMNS